VRPNLKLLPWALRSHVGVKDIREFQAQKRQSTPLTRSPRCHLLSFGSGVAKRRDEGPIFSCLLHSTRIQVFEFGKSGRNL